MGAASAPFLFCGSGGLAAAMADEFARKAEAAPDAPNGAARALLNLYDAKGVFNNREDGIASLSGGLRQRFAQVEIETEGCVALFRAA